MAQFEKVFEDLDVNVAGMNGALEGAVGQSAGDQSAVTELLQQLQAEAGLAANMDVVGPVAKKIPGQ